MPGLSLPERPRFLLATSYYLHMPKYLKSEKEHCILTCPPAKAPPFLSFQENSCTLFPFPHSYSLFKPLESAFLPQHFEKFLKDSLAEKPKGQLYIFIDYFLQLHFTLLAIPNIQTQNKLEFRQPESKSQLDHILWVRVLFDLNHCVYTIR